MKKSNQLKSLKTKQKHTHTQKKLTKAKQPNSQTNQKSQILVAFHTLCFVLPQSTKGGKTATDIILSFLTQQNILWWLHNLSLC